MKSYISPPEKGFAVYVIRHKKYFYYGITRNRGARSFSHFRSIYDMVVCGLYEKPLSESKCLRVHKMIACDIIKSGFNFENNRNKVERYYLDFYAICVCKTKEEALNIEKVLIQSAKSNKNCLNVKKRIKDCVS